MSAIPPCHCRRWRGRCLLLTVRHHDGSWSVRLGTRNDRRRCLLHIAGPRPVGSQQVPVMQEAIVQHSWAQHSRSSVYVLLTPTACTLHCQSMRARISCWGCPPPACAELGAEKISKRAASDGPWHLQAADPWPDGDLCPTAPPAPLWLRAPRPQVPPLATPPEYQSQGLPWVAGKLHQPSGLASHQKEPPH